MKHKAKYKLLMQQLSEALNTFGFSNQQKDELVFFPPFNWFNFQFSVVCSELHFVYSGCACVKHLSCFCSLGSPAADLLPHCRTFASRHSFEVAANQNVPISQGADGKQPNTDHIRLQKHHTVSHCTHLALLYRIISSAPIMWRSHALKCTWSFLCQ